MRFLPFKYPSRSDFLMNPVQAYNSNTLKSVFFGIVQHNTQEKQSPETLPKFVCVTDSIQHQIISVLIAFLHNGSTFHKNSISVCFYFLCSLDFNNCDGISNCSLAPEFSARCHVVKSFFFCIGDCGLGIVRLFE